MKVLFIGRHFAYFKNYHSVIEMLLARGHTVHLAAERDEDLGGREMVDQLARAHDRLTLGWVAEREDRWAAFATKLRLTIDYLRYLEPAYASTPKLRTRAQQRTPRGGLWLVALAALAGRLGRRLLGGVLRRFERAIPRSAAIEAFLREQQPDVVLLTPLIGVVASPQLDYLITARALGYPTALCVWSWDHLSSKAIVRTVPDRLFVWNPTQFDEAVSLHGVPRDRVVVTGAQCFDQWFDRQPSSDSASFGRRVGLPDDRPFLLYVCSALFRGTSSEPVFVQRWIRAIRSSGLEPLASMPVLVRPHPSRLREWDGVTFEGEPNVVLWGRNPLDAATKADYFNSLFHSAAIVGLNTTAFLEGAITGRPVFAPLLPELRENQEGTIHFHYLLHVGGGLLHAERTLEAHCRQLNAVLASGERESMRSRQFVDAFIRPHGRHVAATPALVAAVEAMSGLATVQVLESSSVSVLRRLLAPVAALAARPVMAPLMLSEHERGIADRQRRHREQVTEVWQHKEAQRVAEQEGKAAKLAARQREKAQRADQWRRAKLANRKRSLWKRVGGA